MTVDIYIHGVPNGQRIWSNGGNDQVINQFYGAGNKEQTKFLAEVRKSGGHDYCYYSILKYKNITAENGRAGSYFGLTLKMNMVCTKVKSIFQILEMTFNSAVLGKFLKKEGERFQYTINDFKDKDSYCKTIVEKVMSMLRENLESNDFVNIAPSMLNGKGTPKINIAEYTSESALDNICKNGSVAVSQDYPSSQLASYIQKKDAELSALRQQSQQEISRIQQQATLDIKEQERRSSATIEQIQNQAQQEILQIKTKYSDVDRKILAYDQQLKQLQRDNREMQNTIAHLQRTVQERDHTIERLKHSSASPYSGQESNQKASIIDIVSTRVTPFVTMLIVVAVLASILFLMPSDNSKAIQQISDDLIEMKETIEKKMIMVPDTTKNDTFKLSNTTNS